MPLLNKQEKYILLFFISTAVLGAVVGAVRHNWLSDIRILNSPEILPEKISQLNEDRIIEEHNSLIDIKNISESNSNQYNEKSSPVVSKTNTSISGSNANVNEALIKTETKEKNITKNTSGLININLATKEDFMALPYIGEVKAERIIQLREELKVFTSIDELEKVKGIGSKTLEKIEPLITL